MQVMPCQFCGRMPKIDELPLTKAGVRRRRIRCPNYCSSLGLSDMGYFRWYLDYEGSGDDNNLFKLWNDAQKQNKT